MNNDPFILQIFQNDLEKIVLEWKKLLLANDLEQKQLNFDLLLSQLQIVKQASSLISLYILEELTNTVENYLNQLVTGNCRFTEEGQEHLISYGKILESLATIESSKINDWINENQNFIQNLKDHFLNVSSKSQNNVVFAKTVTFPNKKMDVSSAHVPPNANANKISADIWTLFHGELIACSKTLEEGLIQLEYPTSETTTIIDQLMRAAHSLKGASKTVQLEPIVALAHSMEDLFLLLKTKTHSEIVTATDPLLNSVDLLLAISQCSPDLIHFQVMEKKEAFVSATTFIKTFLEKFKSSKQLLAEEGLPLKHKVLKATPYQEHLIDSFNPSTVPTPKLERSLKISAEHLNHLIGLAGESLVESQRFPSFIKSMAVLRKKQGILQTQFNLLHEKLFLIEDPQSSIIQTLHETQEILSQCQQDLLLKLESFETFARKFEYISEKIYQSALSNRMRPFKEGVAGLNRMVRDTSKLLNKQVGICISGESTQVDRDILEKLEAPLQHLIRNAIDHGIESSEERLLLGKEPQGLLRLDAKHKGGMLWITLSDDGQGIDPDKIKEKISNNKLAPLEIIQDLSTEEIFSFLFLPGFSTAKQVTEISGRGVGLDIVHHMVHSFGGSIQVASTLGKGTSFSMQLPITLSIVSALLVEVAGFPYAIPLARIHRLCRVKFQEVECIEDQQYIHLEDRTVALISAHELFNLPLTKNDKEEWCVVIINDRSHYYGIAVDNFLIQRDIVVRPLDVRLGKVPQISAAAISDEGTPLLIVDIEDMIRTIEQRLNHGRMSKIVPIKSTDLKNMQIQQKRILVVEDSATVRELEKRLLQSQGYCVDTAVDGIEGLLAAKSAHYDLIITDIDMPRMSGFELLQILKQNENLRSIPIIIVSYKEREEDRLRGIELGAAYYLNKSSFQDDSFLKTIEFILTSC
ncbi:MAG: CheA signal transduction histidine kinase [Chlamydiales bacterium]|jgi:two-component system sensor histidine kinase and response regulator WspE|nr:CheA signal transduction histidine kinase [Chlamydiales bacterium]